MAMTNLEYDTLQRVFAICKSVLGDIEPKLSELQQIYDSAGGVKETLTQADLDSVISLSGLTKEQVDNGVYVLTAVLLPGITQGYSSLSQLSARAPSGSMPLPIPIAPPV